jgi:hypothetical protein
MGNQRTECADEQRIIHSWVIILKVIGIRRAAISNQKSETFKRSSHG